MNWLLPFCFLPVWGWAQSNSLPAYKIYSVARKTEITLDRLVKDLKKDDVIFFGEEHNDSVGHLVERMLFEGLYGQHKENMVLSMEMFQSDVQLILDEYIDGLVTEKNLQNDGRLWKNYADYRPIVEYAREKGLHILAANAPSRYTNRVTRYSLAGLNDLSDAAKKLIAPLPIDTLTGSYYEKFLEMMGGHEGMGSSKIFQSQNLWDATMAWHIFHWVSGHPKARVLHLNGRFHSDEKLGTYAQLLHYSPKIRVSNISCFYTADFETPKWKDWSPLGDFIIISKTARP